MPKLFFAFICCFLSTTFCFAQHKDSLQVEYISVDKDNQAILNGFGFKTEFPNRETADLYLSSLPQFLNEKGFITNSFDRINYTEKKIETYVFLGRKYIWLNLRTISIDENILSKSGFNFLNIKNQAINFNQLEIVKRNILDAFAASGFPFATVFIDSFKIVNDRVEAVLIGNKGSNYVIDSIQIHGSLKVSPGYLNKYLQIKNGTAFNDQILQRVDRQMSLLPFAVIRKPADLSMSAGGATLNIYADNKKMSTIDALIGFLPESGSSKKMQLTGDVNINLNNLFGNAENILLKWQTLQRKSPRLNLGFSRPFIFGSRFGVDAGFDFFKKDSSYLQINALLGTFAAINDYSSGKLSVQFNSNSLLEGSVDTAFIRATKQLPDVIDLSALNIGLHYQMDKLDYIFNPRSGNQFSISLLGGLKKIKKNPDILKLSDANFDFNQLYESLQKQSYNFKISGKMAHFIPVKKYATFKTSLQSGYINSPNLFRNELFQIGGSKTLRGFDEESIYANLYGIATAEFRMLIKSSSYLFGFVDAAATHQKLMNQPKIDRQFLGTGIGIVLETKAGLLNLTYAVGKEMNKPFILKSASKIHFGYINYF